MNNKRIAFQGEPGAYSEEALLLLEPRAEPQPHREFRDVAQAVVDGRADFGLLPIENSLVGSIATNFDLIAESGLAIVGEVVSSVHHCLLGLAGASPAVLRRVLSHPVALAQSGRGKRRVFRNEAVDLRIAQSVEHLDSMTLDERLEPQPFCLQETDRNCAQGPGSLCAVDSRSTVLRVPMSKERRT